MPSAGGRCRALRGTRRSSRGPPQSQGPLGPRVPSGLTPFSSVYLLQCHFPWGGVGASRKACQGHTAHCGTSMQAAQGPGRRGLLHVAAKRGRGTILPLDPLLYTQEQETEQ